MADFLSCLGEIGKTELRSAYPPAQYKGIALTSVFTFIHIFQVWVDGIKQKSKS